MAIELKVGDEKFVQTPTGLTPRAILGGVDRAALDRLANEIHADVKNKVDRDEVLAKIDRFREGVGALFWEAQAALDRDTARAYAVTDSLWHCLKASLFPNRLRPQKHFRTCGPNQELASYVTRLANMPYHIDLERRWGLPTWHGYLKTIGQGRARLAELEQEYRQAAIAVVQIGMGMGGMILGVIGLVVGFLGLLPLFLSR